MPARRFNKLIKLIIRIFTNSWIIASFTYILFFGLMLGVEYQMDGTLHDIGFIFAVAFLALIPTGLVAGLNASFSNLEDRIEDDDIPY